MITATAATPVFLTAGLALLFYLVTIAPDLTWANFGGDGGELITAAMTFGIPHPPGYPAYVLLGKAFSFLPIGSVAYRFNLFSAFAMAQAAGLTAFTAGRLARYTGVSREGSPLRVQLTAGLSFAFAPLVWGQAVIAEVYALHLLFLSASLAALCLYLDKATGRRALAVGLLAGLTITGHLTGWLIIPLLLRTTRHRHWPALAAGTVAGLSPFLSLPLLANGGSPVIWGRPDTLRGWWWLVTATLYRPNVLGLPLGQWWPRLTEWSGVLFRQLIWIGLPVLGITGKWRSLRQHKLLTTILVTIALYGAYTFTYATNDAIVFFLPGLLLLSILLGISFSGLGKWGLLLPVLLVALNWEAQSLRSEPSIATSARELLDAIPSDALVITPGEQSIAALLYVHHVEARRPDLIIVDGNLFQFDWYREHVGRDHPALLHLKEDDLPGFIERNRVVRSVCQVSLLTPEINHCQGLNSRSEK